MTIAIEARSLTRDHGNTRALDNVSFAIHRNTITGLLGRNGAGKTTFMALATGQDRPTSGTVLVNGHSPFEHAPTVEQMCFIRDNQRYPDDYALKHCLRAGAISFPNWDARFAEELVAKFRIPMKTVVKKMSRGQISALAIVLGFASRAPITFFDEPYLGLDATARSLFYDTLLADFAAQPRTFVVSTHLISEMDRILERVVLLDEGAVKHDADVDELRGLAHQVTGRDDDVAAYTNELHVLRKHRIGGLATAIVEGSPDREAAARCRVDLAPVSLQDLVAAYGADDSERQYQTEGVSS